MSVRFTAVSPFTLDLQVEESEEEVAPSRRHWKSTGTRGRPRAPHLPIDLESPVSFIEALQWACEGLLTGKREEGDDATKQSSHGKTTGCINGEFRASSDARGCLPEDHLENTFVHLCQGSIPSLPWRWGKLIIVSSEGWACEGGEGCRSRGGPAGEGGRRIV